MKGVSLLIIGFGCCGCSTATWPKSRNTGSKSCASTRRIVSSTGRSVKVFNVTPKQLKELSAGTFVYAAIFLTEGTGLLLRKHWAEYMTLISTGLFIPLEIYEIHRHFTMLKLVVTVVNVADRLVSRGAHQAQIEQRRQFSAGSRSIESMINCGKVWVADSSFNPSCVHGIENTRRRIRRDSSGVCRTADRLEANLEIVAAREAGFVDDGPPCRPLDQARDFRYGNVLSRPTHLTGGRPANHALVVGRQDRAALRVGRPNATGGNRLRRPRGAPSP